MMMGASPPRPKCEISVTAAAKIDATPPSIALPPAAMIRAPASTVKVRPAATTPCAARTSPRTDGADWPDAAGDRATQAATASAGTLRREVTRRILLRFAQSAHGERAQQRARHEEQKRPSPPRHRTDRRHQPDADHRQQETGAGLQ